MSGDWKKEAFLAATRRDTDAFKNEKIAELRLLASRNWATISAALKLTQEQRQGLPLELIYPSGRGRYIMPNRFVLPGETVTEEKKQQNKLYYKYICDDIEMGLKVIGLRADFRVCALKDGRTSLNYCVSGEETPPIRND